MRMLKSVTLTAALIGLGSMANAAELDIQAEFTPDATNPGANRFVNKTESTGFCKDLPTLCANTNRFSLIVPIETIPTSLPEGTALRDGAMIRVDNTAKTVPLSGPEGTSTSLQFNLSHFGAIYRISPSAEEIGGSGNAHGHGSLWYTWVNPPPGCGYVGGSHAGPTWYRFFWTNTSGASCGKPSNHLIPSFQFTDFNIAYELVTPAPLSMPSGTYTGSVTYSVGPGRDIDFGDRLEANYDTLTFNLTLKVNHILNVRFPNGANRLTLYPPGGWRAWLASRQVPDKLTAHQDFEIWSSGQFKMQLKCEYSANDGCAIENRDGDRVPVTTRVTLPSGLTGPAGLVKETPLSETTPLLIDSTHYVDNGRARLDFEVAHAGVEQMTGHAGTKYSGNVTVIWDSQI